jgi:hypothetical protein
VGVVAVGAGVGVVAVGVGVGIDPPEEVPEPELEEPLDPLDVPPDVPVVVVVRWMYLR